MQNPEKRSIIYIQGKEREVHKMKFLVKIFLDMNALVKEALFSSLSEAVFIASLASLDEDCQSVVVDIDTGEVLKDFL